MDEPKLVNQMQSDDEPAAATVVSPVRRRGLPRSVAVAGLAMTVGVIGFWLLSGSGDADRSEDSQPNRSPETSEGQVGENQDQGVGSIPGPLLAAERFVADPSASTLRQLISAVGGMDAVVIGEAEGAFDLVRFDPLDSDRLLASMRSSYGAAENQAANELWLIDDDGLTQTLWAPETPHDFAHFNVDGSITMWVRRGSSSSFGPRSAVLLDRDRQVITSTEPFFASRFTAAGDGIFALTGDGDYYSSNSSYEDLVAEGTSRRILDGGQDYEWLDNPIPELLVAYPRHNGATTVVWDAVSFERLDNNPLAGRNHQRVAISGDRRTAVGVRLDSRMEQIDLATGEVVSVFGFLDARGIDQPIMLNHNGTIAITVDRSGAVLLWWVGENNAVATVAADAAQPRWVSEPFGARSASAVSASADRVAIRVAARPQIPVRWTVVNTSVDAWIAAACTIGGRPLTVTERNELDLQSSSAACV